MTRTPGGGYWIEETDAAGLAVDAATTAAATAAAQATGMAIGHARSWIRQRDFRKAEQMMVAIQVAANRDDWAAAWVMSNEFVRRWPEQGAGWEALCDAAGNLDGLPPDEVLQTARACEIHGLPRRQVSALRLGAYLDQKNMTAVLQEGNFLVGEGGEFAVMGHAGRAKALLWLGDLDGALREARAAVEAYPDSGLYGLRADVLWARGDLDGALRDLDFAIRLDPSGVGITALERRASILEQQGDGERAAADRAEASRIRAEATAVVPSQAEPSSTERADDPKPTSWEARPIGANCGTTVLCAIVAVVLVGLVLAR